MPITRNFTLYLNAGISVAPTVHVNQYDRGEQWVFTLLDDKGQKYTPSSGALIGVKADGNAIAGVTGTVGSNGDVYITETQQMTAAAGKAIFELTIDGMTHGTANFIVQVEKKPTEDAVLSESDLSIIQQGIDSVTPAAINEAVSKYLAEHMTNPPIDPTLTVSNAAADAKVTGNAIDDLEDTGLINEKYVNTTGTYQNIPISISAGIYLITCVNVANNASFRDSNGDTISGLNIIPVTADNLRFNISSTYASQIAYIRLNSGYITIRKYGNILDEIDDLKAKDIVLDDNIDCSHEAIITGEAKTHNVFHNETMYNGDYAVGDNINCPTPDSTRLCYPFPIRITENDKIVFDSNSAYRISFIAVGSDGIVTSKYSTWLLDGVYTLNEIKANAGATAPYYTFEISKANNPAITPFDVSTVLSIVRTYEPIVDESIVKKKLEKAVSDDLDRLECILSGEKYNRVENINLIYGYYETGSAIGEPNTSNSRVAYPRLLKIESTDSFVFDSDGAYQIAFVAFGNDGKAIRNPQAWKQDGTYSLSDIGSSAGYANAPYYSFQLKNAVGTTISTVFNAQEYCSIDEQITINKDSIPADGVSEDKLSEAVRIKLNSSHGGSDGYDLLIFMGQSNMAGRGITNESHPETAPVIIEGAGYEYRAISDPTKLYPISEPFGVAENKTGGINDGSMKTGSMVTAFANAYYTAGKTPIIAVSASKGGSTISQWQPGVENSLLDDALQRLADAVTYLSGHGYTIRHKYAVWCQGESDMDYHTTKATYLEKFNTMLSSLLSAGIEKLLMVRIGEMNTSTTPNPYKNMIDWQTEIAQTNSNVVMVSTDFAGMRVREMMKDEYHYYQDAYNEVGRYAGVNSSFYANTMKEPTMYDPATDGLYFSHKN